MELCGQIVKHQVFGSGQIVDFTDTSVTVLFDESKLNKKFTYPSAFGPYLELENELLMGHIKEESIKTEQKKAVDKRVSDELSKYSNPIKANLNVEKRPRRVIAKSPVESDV